MADFRTCACLRWRIPEPWQCLGPMEWLCLCWCQWWTCSTMGIMLAAAQTLMIHSVRAALQ